jgi:hypothetical protein
MIKQSLNPIGRLTVFILMFLLFLAGCNTPSKPNYSQYKDATQTCDSGIDIQPREAVVVHAEKELVLQAYVALSHTPGRPPAFQVALTKDKKVIAGPQGAPFQTIAGKPVESNLNVLFVPDIDPDLLVASPYDGRSPAFYLTEAFDRMLEKFNFAMEDGDQGNIAMPSMPTNNFRLSGDKNELFNRWKEILQQSADRDPRRSPTPSQVPGLWLSSLSKEHVPAIVVFIRFRRSKLDSNDIMKDYPTALSSRVGEPVPIIVLNLTGNPSENWTTDFEMGNVKAWVVPAPSVWPGELDSRETIEGNLSPLRRRLEQLKKEITGLRVQYLVESRWKVLVDTKSLHDKRTWTKESDTYVSITFKQDGKSLTCSVPLKFFAENKTAESIPVALIVLIAIFVFAPFIYVLAVTTVEYYPRLVHMLRS